MKAYIKTVMNSFYWFSYTLVFLYINWDDVDSHTQLSHTVKIFKQSQPKQYLFTIDKLF